MNYQSRINHLQMFDDDPIAKIALRKFLEKQATLGGIISNLGKGLYYGVGALGRGLQALATGNQQAFQQFLENRRAAGQSVGNFLRHAAGTGLRALALAPAFIPGFGVLGTAASIPLSMAANRFANRIESGQPSFGTSGPQISKTPTAPNQITPQTTSITQAPQSIAQPTPATMAPSTAMAGAPGVSPYLRLV